MNMIEAAQGYVSQGWKVFPLRPRSKKPLPGTHGKDDATGDPAQVQRWWQAMANANIAVACGATSGIIVIDLDAIDDTNAHDGQATWQKLASHYGDIETRQQRTGGGGLQLFFLHPGAGVEIGNRAQLLPGIDVRGDGGYTVVGPSIHPDTGKAYEWANDIEPQQPPIWLLGILFDDDARLEALKITMPNDQERLTWSKESWGKSPELKAAQPAKALPTGPTVSADSDEMKRWLTVTMDKAYQAVASAPKGQRNAALNRETYSLAGLMPYISRDEIERLMFMAAEKSGYVADDGEAAVRGVATRVVAGEVAVADAVEEVAMANDRMAARGDREGGGEQELGRGVVRIIEAHVDFAADDVLFFLKFGLGQGRVENKAGEALEEDVERARGAIDEVDGAVERGVGVPVAASGLDGVGEGFSIEVAGALEDHVFEKMGDPGTEVAVLMDAAGGDPDLGRDHGGGGVGVEDQGEAVGQGLDGGLGGGVFHEISGLDWEVHGA